LSTYRDHNFLLLEFPEDSTEKTAASVPPNTKGAGKAATDGNEQQKYAGMYNINHTNGYSAKINHALTLPNRMQRVWGCVPLVGGRSIQRRV